MIALFLALVGLLAVYGFHYAAGSFFGWLDRQSAAFDEALAQTVSASVWFLVGFFFHWLLF